MSLFRHAPLVLESSLVGPDHTNLPVWRYPGLEGLAPEHSTPPSTLIVYGVLTNTRDPDEILPLFVGGFDLRERQCCEEQSRHYRNDLDHAVSLLSQCMALGCSAERRR
jgi:hypothetical protein